MNNTELTLDQLRTVSAAGFRDSLGYKDRARNLENAKAAHISAADKAEQAMNRLKAVKTAYTIAFVFSFSLSFLLLRNRVG